MCALWWLIMILPRLSFLLLVLCATNAVAVDQSLKSQVRVILPAGTNTVAAAANYFISPHEYRLAYSGAAPIEARSISRQPIPATVRLGSIMSVEQALLSLLQEDQVLIIDTEAKLVSFGRLANERGAE